jgi:hypothetical protein
MRGLVTRFLVKEDGDRPTPDQSLVALSTLLDAHYGDEWPPVDVEQLIGVQDQTLVEITAELPTLREH